MKHTRTPVGVMTEGATDKALKDFGWAEGEASVPVPCQAAGGS